MSKLYGGIEAGGTKFVCAVADENLNIIDRISIETEMPEKTLNESIKFFKKYNIEKLGIGTFGPVEINPKSLNYGMILNTPKVNWRNINIYKVFNESLDVPVIVDTDVNAAALGEYYAGYGQGKRSVLYITIGTGVGAGFVLEGKTLYGVNHPEMGHIAIKQIESDKYKGHCPYHGNCLEGLVSGPAIEARMGIKAQFIEEEDSIWDINAKYIGQALYSFYLILSPEVILIGGGVSKQTHMFPKIRKAFSECNNDYMSNPKLNSLDSYILYPKNGQDAGLIGSIYLALKE